MITEKMIFPSEENIPEKFKFNTPIHQTEYLINGELRTYKGEVQKVLSPVCVFTKDGLVQKELGSFPLLTDKEATEALNAAVEAYKNGTGEWPTMPVQERIRAMEKFTYRMKEKRDEVVKVLMWETGKPLKDSEKEFDRTVEYIIDTISALKELDRTTSRFEMEQGIISKIRRGPLGVTLCMGPFNYPLNETFTTLIPALIMGNVAVVKLPRFGQLLWDSLLEPFQECLPPGVINIVNGAGKDVIAPAVRAGKIDVLAFIGSSQVANQIKQAH